MHIYYINIAARTDRRDFMEEQFARLGLGATRIEATTPADLTDDVRERWCNPRRGRWLTPSELCCNLSHVAALRTLHASGADRAVILEDDSLLSSRLPDFLAMLSRAPMPAGLVRIETTLERMRLKSGPIPEVGGIALLRPFSWASGSGGYVASRGAAEAIVASREIWLKPTDHILFNPYEPLPRRVGLLQAAPGLTVQTDRLMEAAAPASLGSDIKDRLQRGVAERPYFWRRLPYTLANALERDIVVGLQKTWHERIGGARKRRVDFAVD